MNVEELLQEIMTAESVTEGHPDKVCDLISDAVLDALIAQDPQSRVACETTVCTGMVHLMGEITSTAQISYDKVVRNTLKEIGYDSSESGFDGQHCSVIVSLHEQSQDISRGINQATDTDEKETGAGDQGMMFGYACNETEAYLPLPIFLAHALTKQLAKVRKEKILDYLKPDGKSQVSVRYEAGKPVELKTIVIAAQHRRDISQSRIKREIIREVIKPVIPDFLWHKDIEILVNATGRFVNGGPNADSGLTGRKIIVDTYGGYSRHGGGAFSGKDPTKTDRTGSYAARYLAKNIVASGRAEKCEIQLAYAIGVAHPVSILVDTFGTCKKGNEKDLLRLIYEHFDLRPRAIIDYFDLRRPIYKQTASYGHFGRSDLDLPWEKLDVVDVFKAVE